MDQRYQRGGLGSTNAAVLLAAAVAAAGCATGGGGGATASVDRQGAKLAVSRTAGFHMAKVAPVTLASKRPVGSDPQARGEGREAAKQAAAERARTASILGLIEQSADPDLIAIFYGSGASGCEPESVLLDLVSPAVEDAYHQGGLGQIGSGFAGRGGGETSVGLGSFATLGKGGIRRRRATAATWACSARVARGDPRPSRRWPRAAWGNDRAPSRNLTARLPRSRRRCRQRAR